MSEAIKPCPFCGAHGERLKGPVADMVRCGTPPCVMSLHPIPLSTWNRRVLPEDVRSALEQHFDVLVSIRNWCLVGVRGKMRNEQIADMLSPEIASLRSLLSESSGGA